MFDWHKLIDDQLTSFAGNKAIVIEVVNGQSDSRKYIASEIVRRGLENSVQFLSCESHEAESIATRFKPGECSLVFLAGLPAYESTMRELRAFYPLVHFNSMIAGYGANDPEVMRAVREFFAEKDLPVRVFGNCWACNHAHKPKELW